jgi:hypothetical protein
MIELGADVNKRVTHDLVSTETNELSFSNKNYSLTQKIIKMTFFFLS